MFLSEITENLLVKYKNEISQALASNVALYRGIGNMRPAAVGDQSIQNIRTDRTLLSSSPISGFTFDTIMELKNLPFRKANTASATRDAHQAANYGSVCRIYPLDGTLYLYSKTQGDFMFPMDDILEIIYNELKSTLPAETATIPIYHKRLNMHRDYVEKWLTDNMDKVDQIVDFHVTKNIDELAMAHGEVLMWGTKQFIAVKVPQVRQAGPWG